MAWFEKSRLRYTYARYALLLAEGHLRRGDRPLARSLIEGLLETSRSLGYLHVEGTACWLMAEYLASEAPSSAEPYVEKAMKILERIGARNDLARAMVTRAALRQAAGDVATARALLDEAHADLPKGSAVSTNPPESKPHLPRSTAAAPIGSYVAGR